MKRIQYYQFPLFLLGISPEPLKVMKYCLSYGLAVAGANRSRKAEAERNEGTRPPQPDDEFIFSDQRLVHYMSCAFNQQVAGGESFDTHVERAREGYQYVQDLMGKFGGSPKIRIRRDLLESGLTGTKGLRQQILVFMALLTVIGDKSGPVQCTHDRLIHYCSGCKSQGMFEAMTELGWLKARSLNRNQVSYAVKQLETKRIIARFIALKRISYYSTRLSKDLLREAVLARYAAYLDRLQDEAKEDAEANAAIKRMQGKGSYEGPTPFQKNRDSDDDLPF